MNLKEESRVKNTKLTNDYEVKLKGKEDFYTKIVAEKEKLNEQLKDTITKHENTNKDNKELIEKLKQEISEKGNKILSLENEIKDVKNTMQKIKDDYELLTDKLERGYKEKTETLERNFSLRGDNFKKLHLEEMNKMKADFSEGLRIMEQKHSNLNNK